VNGIRATEPLKIASTYDVADPIAWRQWHHWKVVHDLIRLPLEKGGTF
jgi:hypothetical protein